MGISFLMSHNFFVGTFDQNRTEQKIQSPLPMVPSPISIYLNSILPCIAFLKKFLLLLRLQIWLLLVRGTSLEPNYRPGRWGASCTQPLYQQGGGYKNRKSPQRNPVLFTMARVRSASGRFKSTKGEIWWGTPCWQEPVLHTNSKEEDVSKFFWISMYGVWLSCFFSIHSLPRLWTK